MNNDLLLSVISRWAHIACAIVLVGGTAFTWLVLQPVLQGENAELIARIRNRWKKFVHPAILLFLISGLYNYIKAVPAHKGDGLYHALVGTKMLLALAVFFLASALVGSMPGTQKFRDSARKWTGVALLLATIIVGISGFVKVRPYAAPAAGSAEAAAEQLPAAVESRR